MTCGTCRAWSSFQSTPSARRATGFCCPFHRMSNISIHALREEGDEPERLHDLRQNDFNPRPPRGGRRLVARLPWITASISIHALREEGDVF